MSFLKPKIKTPALPPPPPPPKPIPVETDPSVTEAKVNDARAQLKRKGRNYTIMSGVMGDEGASTGGRSILG